MKKRFLFLTIIILGLGGLATPKLVSLWGGGTTPSPTGRPAGGKGGGGGNANAIDVRAVKLAPTPFAEVINATGTLRADEGVELQAETNGKVTGLFFTEGASVKKGDLLVKINDADLQASLRRATARRQLAEFRESRMGILLKQGGTNQQEYDAALSELEVQRAEIDLIEAQIAKTEIRAPFDGVVGLRFVSDGAYVAPATRIATLQRLNDIKIDFAVPEKYASRIRPGTPVEFTLTGAGDVFSATIYATEPRIDTTTHTILIRAVAANADGRLRPGAFAQVSFGLAEIPDALLVPADAVIPGLDEKNVFVVEDGKAARRMVRSGTRTERKVQILEGLQAGDIVIVSGLQQLRAGSPVRVTQTE